MAYTTQTDVEKAAGGAPGLVELADYDDDGVVDAEVLEAAQEEADAWVDTLLRRQFGADLPFDPVPKRIKHIAAAETVYVLQTRPGRQSATAADHEKHEARAAELEAMDRNRRNPVEGDAYPKGDGGGTPAVVELSTEDESPSMTRASGRGVWW